MVRQLLWNFLLPCGMLGFSGQSHQHIYLWFILLKEKFIQAKSLQMLFLAIVAPSSCFLIIRNAAFQRVFLRQTNEPYWSV